MSNSRAKHVVLMGLPATGKTSFLAALWYLVQHRQVASRLRLERFEGDSKYLNQISQAWAGYELVPHTSVDSETVVSMVLKDAENGETITVTFPDLSGESFTLQWTTRQFTTGYDDSLQQASGAILFITPLYYRKPIRIDMAAPLIEEIVGGEAKQESIQDTGATLKPWNPETAPTQVELVELLQFIIGRSYFKAPFRLAIIVSAWDRLSATGVSPSEWVFNTFPLFRQYLSSNNPVFQHTVYGVSAQGCDYGNLAKTIDQVPSERIQVVGSGVKNAHDLTEPLLWLMQ
jgi:hypothetical protein